MRPGWVPGHHNRQELNPCYPSETTKHGSHCKKSNVLAAITEMELDLVEWTRT